MIFFAYLLDKPAWFVLYYLYIHIPYRVDGMEYTRFARSESSRLVRDCRSVRGSDPGAAFPKQVFPAVARAILYVRKAGCSRYRARRSHAATHFLRSGSCAVGGERACPCIGEFQVVPRVLRPDRERSGRFFVSRIGSKQTESAKFSTLLYRILQNGKYNPTEVSHDSQPLRTLSPVSPTE